MRRPGESRDCSNPPYFMTLEALGIPSWPQQPKLTYCSGSVADGKKRFCKPGRFCPIAHQMVFR